MKVGREFKQKFDSLDTREQKIIIYRLCDNTLENIGNKLHITPARVQQLEKHAWANLYK